MSPSKSVNSQKMNRLTCLDDLGAIQSIAFAGRLAIPRFFLPKTHPSLLLRKYANNAIRYLWFWNPQEGRL